MLGNKKKNYFKKMTLNQITMLGVVYRMENHLNIPITVVNIAAEMEKLKLIRDDLVSVKDGVRNRLNQIQHKTNLIIASSWGGAEKEYFLSPKAKEVLKGFVKAQIC